MRYCFFYLLLIMVCQLGKAQSLRPLDGLEYGPALYCARLQQVYVFEGRENRRSQIKIIDDKYGKLKKSIDVDSIPSLQVMSSDERFIYFTTLFPLRINKFDLETDQVIAAITVPDSIQNINGLSILPDHPDRLIVTWYKEARAAIALLENGKWIEAKNAGTFIFNGVVVPNDSTFYATTVINHTFIKGKVKPGSIAITDTITGFPQLNLGRGILHEGYCYLAQGYLLDLRGDKPVLTEQITPSSPLGYHQVTSFSSSPYAYAVEDLFNGFKVYKVRKLDWKLLENWTVPKTSGSSSFTLFIATQNDGFLLSNYSRSYLYKRCTSQTPLPGIKEGYSVQACVLKDSTAILHASHVADEYLWSNGATTSSLLIKDPSGVYVQYGDSLGCLGEPSPIANISFPPPRGGPWISDRSEAFSVHICAKQMVYLNASHYDLQHFEWSNGASGITLLVTQGGKYRARSIDAAGCPSLWSAEITVEQSADTIPVKPVIQSTKGNFNYCEGEVAELFLPSGYKYYTWQGQITSQTNWKVSAANWVSAQVGNDLRCLSEWSEVAKVNFFPKPKPPSIQRLGSTLATNNFGETHEWYFHEQLIPEEHGQFLSITQNGAYRVRTLVNGCYSNFSPVISVQDLLTSTRNLNKDSSMLRVYPNPVQAVLQVQTQNLNVHDCTYQLLSPNGTLLQSGAFPFNGQLSTNNLPRGFYLLLLKDSQGATQMARFIKH